MQKILLPIDGTERSLRAVCHVRHLYGKYDVEIVLLSVCPDQESTHSELDRQAFLDEARARFQEPERILEGYHLREMVEFGSVANTILRVIDEEHVSSVIMTKSTKVGNFKHLGGVTSQVLKYARCMVVVVPEMRVDHYEDQPKGLVTLEGRFTPGVDTCLLPAEAGKCVYEFEVVQGMVRISHLAYNPDGGAWNQLPQDFRTPYYKLEEGDRETITFFIAGNFGKKDRVELFNPNYFEKAIVKYRFTHDPEAEEEDQA